MGQRSSQLPEPPTSSRSDLGELVSEVVDSKANKPLLQYLTHPDGPLSHAISDTVVEVVSKKTESEAVRLLAAHVPPELFDDILFYVNVDRISQRELEWSEGEDLKRNGGEPSPWDILPDLKRCSLVCIFWANRCRQHMFSGRTLEIKSYEDAEIFRRYVGGGCPRLTPIHQLIEKIIVAQDYKSRRSFLHLVYLPAIQDKLKQLFIKGPVPDGFNPAKLDTPHWGIPPCIVVPSSFLQNTTISLDDVHLPSFHHVAKYMRHFTCATYLDFRRITWDGQTPAYLLPHASSTISCQRRPCSLGIDASGDCTNSVHLALTALMMNPNCPLHRLSDEERVWMITFMTLLWGDKKDPYVIIGFDVSEQTTTVRLYPFYFAFEEGSAPTDRSASTLSVVGMHAYIYDLKQFPANFDALVNHARTHRYPTIRALVLLFHSLDRFQNSVKPFVEALDPATEAIEFVCAYEEVKDEEEKGGKKRRELTGRVLGVDMFTLEPTGRIWAELPNGWGKHKSLEILRRELKRH